MKKMDIKPFRDFWQDCFNCIVYSITDYTQEVPKLYYYNNMYTYLTTDETTNKSKRKYKSITSWPDNFRMLDDMTMNRQKIILDENSDPIALIKEHLDAERIVLLRIDLFYWIDEGLHYLHNHIIHQALAIGYDDDTQELIVLETGNDKYAEFRVPYNRVLKALSAAYNDFFVQEINKEARVKMFNKNDIGIYAGNVIKSIDEKLDHEDEILKIDGFEDDDLSEVLDIIQTHMFTMQNRSNINAYMFENAFESDSIEGISLHEEFEKSGEDFEKLKGACIKAKYRTNKENEIRKIKDKVYSLLGKERSLWNLYIENKDRLRMKEFIA